MRLSNVKALALMAIIGFAAAACGGLGKMAKVCGDYKVRRRAKSINSARRQRRAEY